MRAAEKRVAILVIAATNQPVYRHYIETYWTELIRHTRRTSHIDVFMLLENGAVSDEFADLADNVIEDPEENLDRLLDPRFRRSGVPGILSKTIHAFAVLHADYDVFFRTNLSSMLKLSAFDRFVQQRDEIGYAGAWVWTDALRADLVSNGWVGPERSVTDLAELDGYPGNTFVSGAGYFLGAEQARFLVEHRRLLRYDIADDVAVGLMFDRHELLPEFSDIITPDLAIEEMVERIRSTSACHIRLQHFPRKKAEAVWGELRQDPVWR